MLRRLDLTATTARPARSVLPRAALDVDAAVEAIRPIVQGVRDRGYPAAREATLRFDGVDVAEPRVAAESIAAALAELMPEVRDALVESIRRARIGHEVQRRDRVHKEVVPGGTVTEKWIPIERVGLYVPGGLAVYPSSVVMNVVPAQVAGVDSLVVCSPPQKEFDGLPHPTILAACALLGVEEVYAVGGAQAVALLGYGDAPLGIEPVDLITGPGNVYVAAAKRMLRGTVGIDAEAGPTEIAVLADAGADPAHVAADLISQAEHDTLAASVLVTDSRALADAVDAEVVRQVGFTKHVERVTAALTGTQSATVIVRDMEQGLQVVDAYAAEHLEVITADARALAERVRNAGCIFVGTYSPVSLGDYCAGSNHVLPTGCTARHASGLSVQSFLKGVHLVEYTRAALVEAAPFVLTLAEAEDLPAHGAAVSARLSFMTGASPVSLDDLPIRDDLRGRQPYGAPQLPVAVALNTNENSYPLPPALLDDIAAAAREVAGGLNRYPDREALALRADLADFLGHGLSPDEVWAANGSNEILQQLFQAFAGPGRTVLGFTPSYLMHVLIARGVGSTFLDGRRAADFTLSAEHVVEQIRRHRPDIVILCSPNNPTGTSLELDVVRAAVAVCEGLVIVDEAYAEFARPGTVSALALLPDSPRLVVTRTMSKAFGMAGLRLGYLAAAAGVIDAVRLVRLPYHLSSLTQAAARAALARRVELLDTVAAVKHQRDRIVDTLTGLGFTVAPSDANFVFFGGLADSAATWQRLLDAGVLVRDLTVPGWLRVTAGTPVETDAFLRAAASLADDPATWAGGDVISGSGMGETVGREAAEKDQRVQGGVR